MKRTRGRAFASIAMAAVVSIGLAACGGDDSSSESVAPNTEATPSSEAPMGTDGAGGARDRARGSRTHPRRGQGAAR